MNELNERRPDELDADRIEPAQSENAESYSDNIVSGGAPSDGALPTEIAEAEQAYVSMTEATETTETNQAAEPSTETADKGQTEGSMPAASEAPATSESLNNTVSFTPIAKPEPLPPVKTGMKVFFGIVAIVLTVCVCLAGGYIAGREMNLNPGQRVPAGVVSKPSDEAGMTETEIYNKVSQSVVGISVYNKDGETSTASGVVLSSDGYIITNDHIYSGTSNPYFVVITADGKSYDAVYVAGDTRSDLAVIKASATDLKPAEFGNSAEVTVGEKAYAVGCTAGSYEKAVLTGGIVSSVTRRVQSASTSYSAKFIQTDSALNPGSSGGALSNEYGQVIGITSSKYAGNVYDSIGFAIPSNSAVEIANLLIENGYVKGRAKLGISYTENTEVMSKIDGSVKAGLKIAAINSDSSFKNTDVEIGDVIVGVNNNRVTRGSQMLDFIENVKAGDTITVTVYRSSTGTEKNYSIVLGEDKGSSSYNFTGGIDSDTAIN